MMYPLAFIIFMNDLLILSIFGKEFEVGVKIMMYLIIFQLIMGLFGETGWALSLMGEEKYWMN